MHAPLLRIPFISISPRKIVHYTRTLHSYRRRRHLYPQCVTGEEKEEKEEKEEEKEERNEILMKKRLKDCVYIMCDTARKKKVYSRKRNKHFTFKVAFMTLTLPGEQLHTDRDVHYNIFRPFMRRLKSMIPSLLYVWKVETQENGHLHYHLLINEFIHYSDIRKWWNYYCIRAGYRKHCDANSTDIHSLRNVRDEGAYVAKYMTKKEGKRRKVDMKVWDCSEELKKAKRIVIEMPSEQVYNECRVIAEKGAVIKHYDYCSVQRFRKSMLSPGTILHDMYQQLLRQVLDAIPTHNTLQYFVV